MADASVISSYHGEYHAYGGGAAAAAGSFVGSSDSFPSVEIVALICAADDGIVDEARGWCWEPEELYGRGEDRGLSLLQMLVVSGSGVTHCWQNVGCRRELEAHHCWDKVSMLV